MVTNKSEIQTAVKAHLSGRLRAQNLKGKAARLKEEAAFIAGASAALHAVFGDSRLTDYVPPVWILSIIAGRSILDEG